MKRTVVIQLDVPGKGEGVVEGIEEIVRRLHEVVAAEYMKSGDDLYGYSGPMVRRMKSIIIDPL